MNINTYFNRIYATKYSYILLALLTYSVSIPFARLLLTSSAGNVFLSLIADVLLLLVITLFLYKEKALPANYYDFIVLAYLIICIATGLNIVFIQRSDATLFFYGMHMTVLPVLFFFGGKLTGGKEDTIRVIWLVGLCHILIALAFYKPVLELMPAPLSAYMSAVNKLLTSRIHEEEQWGLLARLRSTLDSLSFGNIASVTALISCYFTLIRFRWFYLLALTVSILSVILCNQRSAWVGTLLGLITLAAFMTSRRKFTFVFTLSAILIILLYMVINLLSNELLQYMSDRCRDVLSGGREAIGSRSSQWEFAYNIFSDYPFGIGIGQLGHKSVGISAKGVYDGNYQKILAETGFLGAFFFLLILFEPIKYFLTSLKRASNLQILLLVLLIFYMFQAVGTNVWDLYYCAPIFWLLLGLFANKNDRLISC